MSAPFPKEYAEIADSMGIALYQRFTFNEATLFLRCSKAEIQKLVRQGVLAHIKLPNGQSEFFGYQLLEYVLGSIQASKKSIQAPTNTPDRIIRSKEVQALTGLSRTTLWRMENAGTFPRRVSLGVGSVGWKMSDIQDWVENRT